MRAIIRANVSGVTPRRGDDVGFTLVELLIALVVIGILSGVAIGSFLGARERAERSAAESNLRTILPSVHSYFSDNGTYATMTLAALKAEYDPAIDVARYSFGSAGNLTDSSFCIQSTVGNETYRKAGPDADIVPGTCP